MKTHKQKKPRPVPELFGELCRVTGERYESELDFNGSSERAFVMSLPLAERDSLLHFLHNRIDAIRRRSFDDIKRYYAPFEEVESYLDDSTIPHLERITFLSMYLQWGMIGYGAFHQALSNGEVLSVTRQALTPVQTRLLETRLDTLIREYPQSRQRDHAVKRVRILLTQAEAIAELPAKLLFLKQARMDFDSIYPGPSSGIAQEAEWVAFRRLNSMIDVIETQLRFASSAIMNPPQDTKPLNPILRDLDKGERFVAVRSFLESLQQDEQGHLIWTEVEGDLPLFISHIRVNGGLPPVTGVHIYTSHCFVWSDRRTMTNRDLSRKLGNMQGIGGRRPGEAVERLIDSMKVPTSANNKPT